MATHQDIRSISELFAAATDWTLDDGDGDWTAVTRLHRIGSREVLDRALTLANSADSRARVRAADILGQLGVPDRTFPDECLGALVEQIDQESQPVVIRAAAFALGHLHDPRAINVLVSVAQHMSSEVRYAVAHSLGGFSDPAAVRALIRLSEDEFAHVRDWATFALGEGGPLNTPEVREALYRRLSDDDASTRFEAMRGLVRCGDARTAHPLAECLARQPDDLELLDASKSLLGIAETEEVSTEALILGLRSLGGTPP